MQVIQVRGCNASGKTTCVNGAIKHYGMVLEDYFTDGKNVMITASPDKRIIVLGRYDKKIGGCDLYGSTKEVVKTIVNVIKQFKPDTIIFEGMIYSKSMLFAENMRQICKNYGYKYKNIYLYRTWDSTIELLDKRSGGGYSKTNLMATHKTCISVYQKMKKAIFDIKKVDVDNLSYEETQNILLGIIDE